ncbi:MAG TPA: S8 family serine peptidase [Rhizomicrobium sp.]|nr:S8 family serine peptidase [Rhizomicrobium sp.]
MALKRLILAALILVSTGAGVDAQLVGGRGIGGVGGIGAGGLGPRGIGGLPSNVPVTTVPGGIATPAIPSAPLSNPVGAVTQPLSTVTPGVTGTIGNTVNGVTQDVGAIAATAGRDLVGRPLNQTLLGRDPRGLPIVPGEVLAVSPSEQSLAIARRLNFRIVRQDQLGALGLSTTVLAAPSGMDAIAALAALRQADPTGSYDYANIYNPTGGQSTTNNTADLTAPPSASPNTSIGMIDGGVEARHSAFASAHIVSRSFAGTGNAPATAHGTAIASLLAGADKNFSGYAPGATVYAADVFGGEPTGGSAAEIALALNWLVENKIAVANISLAGPPNVLLAAAVKAFVESGHVLVAASGNDGPAAPPNYPAAYPGVIGVTAIDAAHHFALDANRNAARFAALGVNVRAAALPAGYGSASGTSYASPLVAARFALLVTQPGKGNCETALATLSHEATPLSETGIAYLATPSGRVAAK